MDDQPSQGSFHLSSSTKDFSPSSITDVTSQGSGADSDISQQCGMEVGGMYEEGEGGVGE